ncbi:TPA: hypothetical protein ACH3X1_006435 [Trebouxia sp. C0004]
MYLQPTVGSKLTAHQAGSQSAVLTRHLLGPSLREVWPSSITPFVPVSTCRRSRRVLGRCVRTEAFFNFGKPGTPGLSDNCWEQSKQKPKYPALNKNTEVDIVVVGAGIVGLTTAYNLTQAGKKVAVLEARVIGGGQSGKDTGEISTWNNHTYKRLESLYGAEKTTRIAASQKAALDFVETVVKEKRINCGFSRQDAFVFFDSPSVGPEFKALLNAGLQDTKEGDFSGTSEEGGIKHCLQLEDAAVLNPVAYLNGLAKAITDKGGKIYEQTRVRKPDRSVLETDGGNKVTAREAVLVATAQPITKDLADSLAHTAAIHSKSFAKRRYAITLSVPKGSVRKGVYFDTANPHHSVRLVEGGDGRKDLLLVSGEEHDQGIKPEEYADYFGRLESWAKSRWDFAGPRKHEWSWETFQSSEKLGLYGKNTVGNTDYYIASGDSGHITVGGTVGGMVIADAILGDPNPYADLYDPWRKLRGPPLLPSYSPTFFKNTISSVVTLLTPQGKSPDISDIPADSGAVLQRSPNKGYKEAVYKDPKGKVDSFSALCPHLGCQLQWNPVEKEWDCPCHGSCFDKKGKQLAGPATTDMRPPQIVTD